MAFNTKFCTFCTLRVHVYAYAYTTTKVVARCLFSYCIFLFISMVGVGALVSIENRVTEKVTEKNRRICQLLGTPYIRLLTSEWFQLAVELNIMVYLWRFFIFFSQEVFWCCFGGWRWSTHWRGRYKHTKSVLSKTKVH